MHNKPIKQTPGGAAHWGVSKDEDFLINGVIIMKRDMELVRKILLFIENENTDYFDTPKIDGYTSEEVSYHIKLLHEEGMVEAEDCSDDDGLNWMVSMMTMSGHDFLDASRNVTIWNQAMTHFKKNAIPFTIGITLNFLKAKINEQLGLE